MSKLKLGKLTLNFKTPDVAERAVRETLQDIMSRRAEKDESSDEEDEDPVDEAEAYDYFDDKIREKLAKFLKYGENIRVEIDLDNGTAVVLPVK